MLRARVLGLGRAAAAVLAAAVPMLVATGCASPTPVPPVAPGRELGTPVGLAGGVLPTATMTPGPSPTVVAESTIVTPAPEPLRLPDRFGVGVFAEGLTGARMMAVAPNGDVFVTIPPRDQIVVLPDRTGDGVADGIHLFATGPGLNKPNGLAFWGGGLYVANTDGIVRFPYAPGDLVATGPATQVVTLPGEGLNGLHSLLVGPDGLLYVGIGSSCDVCAEADERRASILRIAPDASEVVLFARGLRHPAGLATSPDTGAIWVTDSGREGLGQALPPEELNRLSAGASYGWPYCFGDRVPDPTVGGGANLCDETIGPAVSFSAHSAPQGIAFYTARQFPARYQRGLFVAQQGTYDQYLPTGSSVVFVPFANGEPTGLVEGFLEGWLMPDTRRWGRPVDVVVAPDGALLVSDEGGGRIYRVYYYGPQPTATPYG
jgi:glucose/arabinose dehydrogenase